MENALSTTKRALESKLGASKERAIANYNRGWIINVQNRIVETICKGLLNTAAVLNMPTSNSSLSCAPSRYEDGGTTPRSTTSSPGAASHPNKPNLPPARSVLSPVEIKVFDVFLRHFQVDDMEKVLRSIHNPSDNERVRKVSRHGRSALRHVIMNKFDPDELQNANVQFLIMRMLPLFPLATEKGVVDAFRDCSVPLHLVDQSFLALDAQRPQLTQNDHQHAHRHTLTGAGDTESEANTPLVPQIAPPKADIDDADSRIREAIR